MGQVRLYSRELGQTLCQSLPPYKESSYIKVIGSMKFEVPPYTWDERMEHSKINRSIATVVIGSRPPLPETPRSTAPQAEVKKPRRKKSLSS